MQTTANMSLTVWNLLTDPFSHAQLAANWNALDVHDHSSGKGLQISTAGIANNAVTTAKLSSGSVTRSILALGAGFLADRIVGGSVSANLGDMIQSSTASALTVTLPAPTASGLVGVFTPLASAASPVTIARSGSALIVGPGHSGGVTSIVLGVTGTVLLYSDGVNWFVIGGRQDTGWLPITLATTPGSGVTATGTTYTPSVRVVGDIVQLAGVMTNATGSPITNSLIGTIPVVARPAIGVSLPSAFNLVGTPTVGFYSVAPSGNFSATTVAWSAANIATLDGLSYRLI